MGRVPVHKTVSCSSSAYHRRDLPLCTRIDSTGMWLSASSAELLSRLVSLAVSISFLLYVIVLAIVIALDEEVLSRVVATHGHTPTEGGGGWRRLPCMCQQQT